MRPLALALSGLCLCAAAARAQDVAAHLAAGDAARCRRNGAEALEHYRAALATDSMHYEANWKAARELADLGATLPSGRRAQRDSIFAEARARAERAVSVNGGGADGHFAVAMAVGRLALTRGPRERVRYARVVRDQALRATELDPQHGGAHHVLGRWNAEIQRLPGVTKLFARTFLGASVFSEASWDNAVRYFTEAIRLEPQLIYHRLELGKALTDAGRPEDARPQLEQATQLPLGCDPQDAQYKREAAALLQRLTRR